jgi:Ca2+/Na+ antiporter
MATSLPILLFLGSAAVTLWSAAFFGERLDHIGPHLGFSEVVVGLLTAAATDAPEVASALVALVHGDKEISIGVVFGSNVFNLTAMIGVGALLAGAVRLGRRAIVLEGPPSWALPRHASRRRWSSAGYRLGERSSCLRPPCCRMVC